MTDQVELIVTAQVPADEVADIRTELRAWGWEPEVRRIPTRRGGTDIAWILLLTVPAETIAKTILERLGTEIYQELRGFVRRRMRPGTDSGPARAVVIESADTGARFALDADLPLDAYQQMIEALTADAGAGVGVGAGAGAGAGASAGAFAGDELHIFDRGRSRWVAASG